MERVQNPEMGELKSESLTITEHGYGPIENNCLVIVNRGDFRLNRAIRNALIRFFNLYPFNRSRIERLTAISCNTTSASEKG